MTDHVGPAGHANSETSRALRGSHVTGGRRLEARAGYQRAFGAAMGWRLGSYAQPPACVTMSSSHPVTGNRHPDRPGI